MNLQVPTYQFHDEQTPVVRNVSQLEPKLMAVKSVSGVRSLPLHNQGTGGRAMPDGQTHVICHGCSLTVFIWQVDFYRHAV